MVNKPKFISYLRHGESDFAPPLIATNDTIFGFLLKGDRHAVQKLVDGTLGATGAAQSGITYTALSDYAILLFQHCGRFTSPAKVGWAEDHETAILIPLSETKPGALARPVLWIPYLMIDLGLGMVTGRDVWGFNKTQGWTTMPKSENDPAEFKCDTVIFRKFSSDCPAEVATLVKVAKKTGTFGPLSVSWGSSVPLLEKLLEAMELGIDVALEGNLPVIDLKQMRDTEHPELACYQALVASDLRITRFDSAGFLDGEYEVDFLECESHQIARDFGFKSSTKVPVTFAFWAKLDFTAPAGSTVWQAQYIKEEPDQASRSRWLQLPSCLIQTLLQRIPR